MPRGVPGSGPTARQRGVGGPSRPVIELEWQDPPPEVPRSVQPYVDVLLELQDKKEAWGRIATFAAATGASTAEKKLTAALEELDFGVYELTSRQTVDGSELYARWMGV